jgi:hypothetical protein
VSNEEHDHQWGAWSDWAYAGHDTDMRTRTCGAGRHADAEWRTHAHDWQRRPDVFAPIGSGLTIMVCTGCGGPKK